MEGVMKSHLASLSLDLDNKWSYLRTYGSNRWQEYPTYLPEVVPIILEFLERHHQAITFFLVGRDAASPRHADCIRAIANQGHDIANHSFNHEPWLHLFSEDRLDNEIKKAEEAIFNVTGRETSGFRGPGFSISSTHLNVLAQRGFKYDASVFPNLLNPLSRAYFFAKSGLSEEEKKQRQGLFGTLSDALRPVDPFVWKLPSNRLLEIPVTTMPFFRLPFHFSYILYLSGFSTRLASLYFRIALWLCRRARTSPSLLLHPLDFLGSEDETELGFFPGMNLSRAHKLQVLDRCMGHLKRHFRVTNMAEHAAEIEKTGLTLRAYVPNFKN